MYNMVEGEDKEVLRKLLQYEKDKLQRSSGDWQSANVSRARALQLLQGFGE
jgi:hypothetical protein